MVGRLLLLVAGVAAQVTGIPPGAICQAKLVPYTKSTPIAESNLFINTAQQDWNNPTLHLDTLQLWSDSFGGGTGTVTGNPALDNLQRPRPDDISGMVSRLYVKDLKNATTYFTRVYFDEVYGTSMAFRILNDPAANPMMIEFGTWSTWTRTRQGGSPIYDSGSAQTLARGKPCAWVNYPKA